MIDVKEAVTNAVGYLKQLYDASNLNDILLEEVELSGDEQYWYVTLGFSRPIPTRPKGPFSVGAHEAIESMFGPKEYQREYKVFQIDSATGQVKSMKIRAA
jgi:hypothetical protein